MLRTSATVFFMLALIIAAVILLNNAVESTLNAPHCVQYSEDGQTKTYCVSLK